MKSKRGFIQQALLIDEVNDPLAQRLEAQEWVGVGMMKADAAGSVGNLLASKDIDGDYTAEGGTIGDVIAETGDLGSQSVIVVDEENDCLSDDTVYSLTLRALGEGGITIDPETGFPVGGGNDTAGIGNVFAYLGDVNVDAVTAGSIGTENPISGQYTSGGVATLTGDIYARLISFGNMAGLYAPLGEIILSCDSVFNTDELPIDALPDGETFEMDNITEIAPFVISDEGVELVNISLVGPGNGEAVVIRYDDGIEVVSFTVTGATADTVVTIQNDDVLPLTVREMVITSDLGGAMIDGDLWYLRVVGDLGNAGDGFGGIDVEQYLGDVYVSGTIDHAGISAGGESNIARDLVPWPAGEADPDVEARRFAYGINSIFAGVDIGPDVTVRADSFGRIEADGINHGLETQTLENKTAFTWENTLNEDGIVDSGDEYITAYLQTGSATLTLNFGFLEQARFFGNAMTNFLVFAHDGEIDTRGGTAPVLPGKITYADGAQEKAALKTMQKQANLVKRYLKRGDGVGNEVFEPGQPEPNVADVGTVFASADGVNTLKNIIVEGDLRSLAATYDSGTEAHAGSANMVVSAEDLGFLGVTYKAQNIYVKGDAGHVHAQQIKNLDVEGVLLEASAGTKMTSVDVHGGAGILATSGTMTRVNILSGGALEIGANKMTKVTVSGGVGAFVGTEEAPDDEASDQARVFGLNSAFDLATVDTLFNIYGGSLSGISSNGYLGGVNAVKATHVSVSGKIANLRVDKIGNGQMTLDKIINNGYYHQGRDLFIKEDGVIVYQGPTRDYDGVTVI